MMQALKERLVERANIIQARHDSETAALVKRQVQHALLVAVLLRAKRNARQQQLVHRHLR